jgi:hypothetical protein
MLARIRSIWLAGGGALALTVMLSGIVAAATVLTVVVAPAPAAPVADTTATFEDLDGNGIDDDCQATVSADPVAAASAETAADLDGDGTISVTEAARSGRTGGTNCNHGGYVSVIASASGEPADTETTTETDTTAECVAPVVAASVAPVVAVVLDPAPNAHGKAVSDVANSEAVGGKNCNHGGAVSEAAKKDHDAAKAARDASKAARDAAREARKAARDAAKASKTHGKPAG